VSGFEDSPYIEKLTEVLSSPLDFATFEGVMQANIPELYKRTMVVGKLQCPIEVLENFLVVLRHKIYGYLREGQLLSNNYITLWFLYAQASLPQDAVLTQLIGLVETSYNTYSNAQKEKYIFAHLLCVLRMLNGEGEESVAWFLGEHVWFEGKCYSQMDKDAVALKNFCEQCHISFDMVAYGIKQALAKERFLKASYSEHMGIGIWMLGFFWQVKGYENHVAWRDVIYPVLRELFLACKEKALIEEAMSLHFLMSHIFLNRAQTQEEFKQFNDEVEREASAFYALWAEKNKLSMPQKSSHAKKCIALIKDRIVKNSPFIVEFSLLSALAKDEAFCQNHEIVVYSMATIEKSLDDVKLILEIKKLGFDVSEVALHSLDLQSNFQSHLKRALAIRDDMQQRGIETMIVANNSTPIATFLFASRSAKKQIFWSHGNFEYDVLGIDLRISHSVVLDRHYSFEVITVPMQTEIFYTPESDKERIANERAKYPKDAFILGTIGRLIKVDSDAYLETIAKLMKRYPNTIYIAAGSGEVESIKAKVAQLGIAERFYFPGFVDPHMYGYMIDLWMDTFPLNAGEALQEFYAKGGVYVQLIDDPHYAKTAQEQFKTNSRVHQFLKRYGYAYEKDQPPLLEGEMLGLHRYASSMNEYIKRASAFIENKQLYHAYQILNQQHAAFYNDTMHMDLKQIKMLME
jgi:hypothetical protein